MKTFKAFIKPFEAPQSSVKMKISLNFFTLSGIGTLRVNNAASDWPIQHNPENILMLTSICAGWCSSVYSSGKFYIETLKALIHMIVSAFIVNFKQTIHK